MPPAAVERAARNRAARRPRAAGRDSPPGVDRSWPAERAGAHRTRAGARRPRNPARPWLRMDSCPRETQSGPARARTHRDQAGARARQRAGARPADHTQAPAQEVPPAARAEQGAGRTQLGRELPAEAHPMRAPAAVAGAPGERRMRAGGLPRRADCRRTGKTCWWAGSTRRTACTRSCENSRARAVPRTRARPSAASIPVLPHTTQLKAGGSVRKHRAVVLSACRFDSPRTGNAKTGLNGRFSPVFGGYAT